MEKKQVELTGDDVNNLIAGLHVWVEWKPMNKAGTARGKKMIELAEKLEALLNQDITANYKIEKTTSKE